MVQFEEILRAMPQPYYRTSIGAAFVADALKVLPLLPDESINLIMTSPPFALRRKKEYGNVEPEQYVEWFKPFADELWRVLRPDGSIVIHLGGSWRAAMPVKSLYAFELLIYLCNRPQRPFYLAQDFYWFNTARLPSPAEWVTVRRIRVKDAVDYIWWLCKSPQPKADNMRVLKDYSPSMRELLQKGYVPKLRPSGHDISHKFNNNRGGAIPPNFLAIANTESNSYYLRRCSEMGIKPHPARYPIGLPEFFIRFLTEPGDVVLDPFAGSNVTGEAAQRLNRYWIAIEIIRDYLEGSKFRFEQDLTFAGTEESTPKAAQLKLLDGRSQWTAES
ncbi:Modification methylase PvuII [bacterium HR24]|nr:Modification methylase PvuII [bacterium HR24]